MVKSPLVLPLILAVLCLAAWHPARAQPTDGLQLRANVTQAFDSNLFHLPSDANVQALTGQSSAFDRIGITTLGVAYNKSYSLQRIELDVSVANYRYQKFDYLNFSANNYNAAWLWSLTPRLHGKLSRVRNVTLNSFDDYQNYTQSNQRTNVNSRFDAEYEVDSHWRALGGFARTSQTDQQLVVVEGDVTTHSVEAGVRYAFASGTTITYWLRDNQGSYLNRVLPSAGLYDSGYNQTDNELRLTWPLSGKTRVNAFVNHFGRTHPNYAERDYDGLNAGAGLQWDITGKTSLNASWARQLSSYQTNTSNYTQTDRITFSPVWQIGAKTALRLTFEAAQIDYLGRPTGPVANPRTDTTRDTSLSLDWAPYTFLSFNAALKNARRSSNQAGLDYISNLATFSVQYTY